MGLIIDTIQCNHIKQYLYIETLSTSPIQIGLYPYCIESIHLYSVSGGCGYISLYGSAKLAFVVTTNGYNNLEDQTRDS